MARQDQKTTDRRRGAMQPDPQGGDGYSGERENEFGGELDALGENTELDTRHQDQNTNAWRGERRRKFVEKFDRWRSERAARTAKRGPDSASDGSSRRETGPSAKK